MPILQQIEHIVLQDFFGRSSHLHPNPEFAICSTGYIIHKNLKFKLLKGLAVNDQTNPEGKKHLHGRTNREGKEDQHNVKSDIHL